MSKAIKAGMVTPLNSLSYEQHTFPFGDALRSAVISLDDFKRFAETLQIEVVIWDESSPTQDTDDVICSKAGISIFDATEALTEKYGLHKPVKDALLERMMEAAHRGELIVRDENFIRYTPLHAEVHYYMLERVSEGDLNAWLEKQGAEYRVDAWTAEY